MVVIFSNMDLYVGLIVVVDCHRNDSRGLGCGEWVVLTGLASTCGDLHILMLHPSSISAQHADGAFGHGRWLAAFAVGLNERSLEDLHGIGIARSSAGSLLYFRLGDTILQSHLDLHHISQTSCLITWSANWAAFVRQVCKLSITGQVTLFGLVSAFNSMFSTRAFQTR